MATTLLGLKDLCPLVCTVFTTNGPLYKHNAVTARLILAMLSFHLFPLQLMKHLLLQKKCVEGLLKDIRCKIPIFISLGQCDARFVVCNWISGSNGWTRRGALICTEKHQVCTRSINRKAGSPKPVRAVMVRSRVPPPGWRCTLVFSAIDGSLQILKSHPAEQAGWDFFQQDAEKRSGTPQLMNTGEPVNAQAHYHWAHSEKDKTDT